MKRNMQWQAPLTGGEAEKILSVRTVVTIYPHHLLQHHQEYTHSTCDSAVPLRSALRV